MSPLQVLLIEDSPADAALLQSHLDRPLDNFTVDWVPTFREGCDRAKLADCVLLDLTLPDAQGLETVQEFALAAPEVPVIVLTGHGNEAGGIEAVRLGAQDYLLKDKLQTGELSRAIRYAVERKLAEAERITLTNELAERTRQLALSNSTIFDESLTGMVQLAADARILMANAAMASLVGFTRAELVGTPALDLFGPADGQTLISAITDVFDAGNPHRRDALLVRSDGSTRLAAIQLSRLTMEVTGSPVVLLTANDITAGSSAMLRHAHDQKLEELGRLAAGLAHEIRSPLQYLTTSIDFARSAVKELMDHEPADRDPELREELDESLTEVAEGAARISQIVKGMNILSHRTGNTISDHDVRDALKFPLAVARGQAPAGTEFVVDLGDVPLVACGLGLMQQVVLNLLVNAIDAIDDRLPDAPRHTGKIVVATFYDDDWVKISVTDNGVGMSTDVLERAMEPFFTTKAEGRGTGQGLPLVRDIMNQHGGTVALESEIGEGTTVTVRLPRIENSG